MSAAFLASQRGFPEILLELCEAKASPEAVDLSGARLLDVTIQEGHLELVKLLPLAMAYPDDHKISDLVAKLPPGWFSFEYFPPKTAEGVENLRKRIVKMKEGRVGRFVLNPTTAPPCGTRGSTSELTLKLTSAAKNEFGCVANMHLTCTNQSSEMTENALKECKQLGVRNIVALRGDPPRGQEKWTATEGGFSSALDLVKFIRQNHGDYFCCSVAGYPEGHPDNIEDVPSVASLTPSEQRRCRVAPDGKVTVCRDANFHKDQNKSLLPTDSLNTVPWVAVLARIPELCTWARNAAQVTALYPL
eukprot:g15314.t1